MMKGKNVCRYNGQNWLAMLRDGKRRRDLKRDCKYLTRPRGKRDSEPQRRAYADEWEGNTLLVSKRDSNPR